ncbi:uncharacterized protein B0H18DRAFT_311534 [Fomitopsis serialis]|uniref:uncharacterized protein n=1 Tax=Fomitopsis serialis TaxID=139415 RepID=UPI002007EA3C|nr:uncharacterized protein B0H18DRAFT_311534 [Neoantrodia serialis]KAH9936077.1 hypothetical protein B0H18DRAFT_311534 [Neoantrodia serialis]
MLHEFPPSHAETDMLFKSFKTRYSDGRDRSVSPRSVLECPPFEVPLNSPPPLHPAFLVWCPKTRGLEFAQPPSPPSPYFGGRRRLPSEISTISTSSTDSSGFFDASDREDDFEDFAWPPVPPPTPLLYQESVSDTDTAEEPYQLPAAAAVEYLDRPPISSRHLPPGHSSLYRLPKDNLYKTKPCKFYFTDKSCIKGDKCNFIHDEWERALRPSRPKSEKRMPPPLSTLGRRPTGEAPRQPHPTTPRPTELHAHALPKRPAEDAQRARNPNFYPITWRVIGGGVLMGGRREICQEFMAGRCHEGADCKYAHPGDDGEDSSLSNLYPYMSPLSPVQEEPAYVPSNHSPVALLHQPSICSPVLRSPPLSAHIPSSYTDERRRRGRRAKKPLTIIPPPIPEQPELVGYSAHRVLDGSTLLELETSPPPAAETPDLSPDRLDVASLARSLVRPLSTPPSLSGPRPQVVNLFAAEMP